MSAAQRRVGQAEVRESPTVLALGSHGAPIRGLELPGVEGAVFADAGNAWEKFESFPRPKGSMGLSLRMSLGGYMVLRYDLARRTDFKSVQSGWEKEFYLGFDF